MPCVPTTRFVRPALPPTGHWPADWRHLPWWQPYRDAIEQWEMASPQLPSAVPPQSNSLDCEKLVIPLTNQPTGWVAQTLNTLALNSSAQATGPMFVPQAHLPAGQAYEAFIRQTGQVPTRDNWHDLLNGLIWLHLPKTKHQLNRLQSDEIAHHGVQPKRGAVRDACTVFDENAALLFAPDALWEALQARHWAALFGPLRSLWQESRLLVFGHAALEKLLVPYKSITVHVWRVHTAFETTGSLLALDEWLAQDLVPEKLAQKPFCPLPVLGTPGWWPANTQASFYNDPQVFRPARQGMRMPA